jgi:hypothetical protein
LEEAVDECLLCDVSDAGGFEDQREVVAHDADAIPLRCNSESDGDEEAVLVSWSLEHIEVAGLLFSLSFQTECRFDLLDFKGHERCILVAAGMVFDNEGADFLMPPF